MKLYLVRHAIAHDRDPQRWPDDAERPLTPEGDRRFRAAARGLCRVVPGVDIVLSSPMVRAWQTAEILAEESGWPAPEPSLELADWGEEAVVTRVAPLDATAVALVGHEPWLSLLLAHLLTGSAGGMRAEFKKGAVACVGFSDALVAGQGDLLWLVQPKLLRALAGA